MPSLRIIPGLNTRKKEPKPVTALQERLVQQRQKDLEHTEASNAALLRRLTQEDFRPGGSGEGEHPLDEQNGQALGGEIPEEEEEYEAPEIIDMNQFMPGHLPPEGYEPDLPEDDPVMIALQRERYLADRLANEQRWAWQYAVMLPTFLRCRLATSNWGDCERWDQDFRPPCNCQSKSVRDVDLVDILSQHFFIRLSDESRDD